ncbi:MAG: acyltransferase family protein [Sulfitobacter sp.]
MHYRPEIDGLRALAVVPVILNHAGLAGFDGGFVGVDIFFVISGFLITNILLREIKTGDFTFLNFYERRARRILPALSVMVLATVPFAWGWMYPSMLIDYSESLKATAVFLSNVHFWQSSGYFDLNASFKPLLHTWSLAVEEQFYLLFPLLLLLISNWDRHKITILLFVLAALSFALSEWGWRNEPDANYYFTFSRLWELLAGAILAVSLTTKPSKGNNLLAVFGLVLIIYAITMFNEGTPFPSVYTLVPVVGVLLIIRFAQTGTIVASVLSLKGMVGIGLISYSVYLWHNPLFAFARIKSGAEPDILLIWTLILASFAIGFLSWRFVEQPFRHARNPFLSRRSVIFGFFGISSVLLIGLGAIGAHTGGFIDRYTQQEKQLLSYPSPTGAKIAGRPNCFLDESGSVESLDDRCLKSESTILLLGDSHAAALSFGLNQSFSTSEITASACPPLIGYKSLDRRHCENRNNNILAFVATVQPEIVILHANWALYKITDLDLLAETITSIKQSSPSVRVYVLGGVPQWYPSLPIRLIKISQPFSKSHRVQASLKKVRRADVRLSNITDESGGEFISFLEMSCEINACIATIPTDKDAGYLPVAWDYGHLTDEGSAFFINKIKGDLSP